MKDWERGRVKKSRPDASHLGECLSLCSLVLIKLFSDLGVPDEPMATCRKVMSKTGAVYRGGGFYFLEGNVVYVCILTQVNI